MPRLNNFTSRGTYEAYEVQFIKIMRYDVPEIEY